MAKQQSAKKVKVDNRIQPQLIMFTLVIAAVAAIGAYFITKSSAATSTTQLSYQSTYQSAYPSPDSVGVSTVDDILSNGSAVKVSQIAPGGYLSYTNRGGGEIPKFLSIKNCFTVRNVSTPAKIKIVANDVDGKIYIKTPTVKSFKDSLGNIINYWNYVCVDKTSTLATGKPAFNIQNVSGGPVNVYMMESLKTTQL